MSQSALTLGCSFSQPNQEDEVRVMNHNILTLQCQNVNYDFLIVTALVPSHASLGFASENKNLNL